jgi:acyl carrier protein
MNKVEQLKELITNYWQVTPDAIEWDVEFNGRWLRNFSSLRMLRFIASVEEQLGVDIQDLDEIKSFRDLLRLVTR